MHAGHRVVYYRGNSYEPIEVTKTPMIRIFYSVEGYPQQISKDLGHCRSGLAVQLPGDTSSCYPSQEKSSGKAEFGPTLVKLPKCTLCISGFS